MGVPPQREAGGLGGGAVNAPSNPSRRARKRRGKVGRTGARFPAAHLQEVFDEQPDPDAVAVAVGDESETETPEQSPPAADDQETDSDSSEPPAASATSDDAPDGAGEVSPGEDPADEGREVGVAVEADPAAGPPETDEPETGESETGEPEADEPEADGSETGESGAEEPVTPEPEAASSAEPDESRNALLDSDRDGEPDDEAVDDARSWVRPYVWTGGRTDTTLDFALETLVSARKAAESGDIEKMRDEHRKVLELCDEPRSVSEIAALLAVPLGVAKTLLGAMAEEDMLVVHSNNTSEGVGPDLALMERVLRGLKNL